MYNHFTAIKVLFHILNIYCALFYQGQQCEVDPKVKRHCRNEVRYVLIFPANVKHFSDIFSPEFDNSDVAKLFKNEVETQFPQTSINSLKQQDKNKKVECIIYEQDGVGFSGLIFVRCDFSPYM